MNNMKKIIANTVGNLDKMEKPLAREKLSKLVQEEIYNLNDYLLKKLKFYLKNSHEEIFRPV